MKKFSLAFVFLSVSFIVVLFSCKKINEATELGSNLIPGVDNVNTFDTSLSIVSLNKRFNDSVFVDYSDPVALGDITDPEFGKIHANFCFSFSLPSGAATYPFKFSKDAVHPIDSVVLSLAYVGAYGDTLGDGVQTISVYDIDRNAGFLSDSAYAYNDKNSDFTGTLVGTKTYTINRLSKDTQYVKEPTDTGSSVTKYINVLRIRLDNSLGLRISNFDTTTTGLNSGFLSDSALKAVFPGLAIKSANSGNALAYFNLSNIANTKLTIYYRYNKPTGPGDTTASVTFTHSAFGQSNYVDVQPGGNWQPAINNTAADKVYVESSPSGSYATIVIPGLNTFPNKVIHRAEIIATKLPSANEVVFTPPSRLFLDRKNSNTPDTTFIFNKDISTSALDNSYDLSTFGGDLKSGIYRFNITRYVQDIVTNHKNNDTLRIYAPFRTIVFNPSLLSATTPNGRYQILQLANRIMEGRVVLGGGTYFDPSARLRLRIVYSNL